MTSMDVPASESHGVSLVFQKRIRALRKKVRNVEEIEKKVREGKTINEQQEEAIRSKKVTLAVLEEVEKLEAVVKEKERERLDAEAARDKERKGKKEREVREQKEKEKKKKKLEEQEKAKAVEQEQDVDAVIEKLLKVFYFGRLFDTSTGNTLAHYERAAYLGYDALLNDPNFEFGSGGLMAQKHLDGLVSFAYYLSSRPMNQLLSHEQALERCKALAKEFLSPQDPKGKGLEVPLSDGSFCDMEAMLKRVSLTGFYSIVPTLQSFDGLGAQQQQQQPGTTSHHTFQNPQKEGGNPLGVDSVISQPQPQPPQIEQDQQQANGLHTLQQQPPPPPKDLKAAPEGQMTASKPLPEEGKAFTKDSLSAAATVEKKATQKQRKQTKSRAKAPRQAGQNAPALTEMDSNQQIPTAAAAGGNKKSTGSSYRQQKEKGGFKKHGAVQAGDASNLSENKGPPRKNGKFSAHRQRFNRNNKAAAHKADGNGNGSRNPKQVQVEAK
mmetsp:Transcript_9657/g.18146  ORF Transcript_9657/g.18146 Transcript_9657/m.18146 type:complete len:496 (-) Transcript_9657:1558-3045(-)